MFIIDENKNITIVRGDSAEIEIEITETTDEGETQAYELTENDELLFTVKKSVDDTEILFQKSGSVIMIDPEDTAELAYGVYRYDVQLTDGSGYVDTVIQPHKFKIVSEVTW